MFRDANILIFFRLDKLFKKYFLKFWLFLKSIIYITRVNIKWLNAGTIVLEDLKKLKKNTSRFANGAKRQKHNNMLSQVPFAEFKERLTHKAHLCGMKVKTVNPANTSKTDSRTGQKNGVRRGCRYYCKDKVILDADWNAAVNIARKSKLPCSNVLPKDGCLEFLYGRPLLAGQSYVNPA